MRLNPIVKKEIRVQARSMRICWEVFAYEAIMAAVFFFAMLIFEQTLSYSQSNIYSSITGLFPVLGMTQLMILGVVIPVRTSTAISGEKERQTFDIMMTTSMSPFSIIMGKAMTAIMQGMFFVVAGMPILALAFVIGGMSWGKLFTYLGVALLVSLFSAGIGIFCSSVCRQRTCAVLLSYGIYVGFFVLTALPMMLAALLEYTDTGAAAAMPFLLFNPACYLTEFFTWSMTGVSMAHEMITDNKCFAWAGQSAAAVHIVWMLRSTLCLVLFAFFFLLIAKKRISPVSKRKAKKLSQGAKVNG